MVTVIDFVERKKSDGSTFFALVLQGGVEFVKSKISGKMYATAKKASISSTFDKATCKALVGTKMDGCIIKVSCEPYEYTVKDTGEVIQLEHRYEYVQEEEEAPIAFQKLFDRKTEMSESV